MAVSKVIVNGVTKVDLTQDTVASSNLSFGYSAHDCAGEPVLGSFKGYDPKDGVDRDVNFVDYDGTVLYSYTADDFEDLDSLPANPTHSGLVSQGWNWTYAEICNQLSHCPGGVVNVGQMYITDDNKTRIYCYFNDQSPKPYLGFTGTSATYIYVDWGDGSQNSEVVCSGITSLKYTQHTYPGPGKYVITLSVSDGGTLGFYGYSGGGASILQSTSSSSESETLRTAYLDAIEKIEIGSNVQLRYCCFFNCRNLKTVTIPSSCAIYSNCSYFFKGCCSLKAITLPRECVQIADYFAENCFSLEHVMIPSSVTDISGSYCFRFAALKSITIPHGVTAIGYYSLNNSSITSVVIPSTVTVWSTYAFASCSSLETVSLMSGLTKIGNGNIFQGCFALSNVIIPQGVTDIYSYSFASCHKINSLEIPNTVTSIGNYAFSEMQNLEYVYLPSSVTSFGTYLFQNDYALRYVGIEPGATTISDHMFSNCLGLQVLTIPQTITAISTYAFQNCQGMREYHFLSTTPPSLANTNAFGNIQSYCKIYVPYSSDHSILNAYKTATNWSTYASYMEEEPAGWRRILTTVASGGTVSVGTEFTVNNRLYGDVDFIVRRSNVDKITGNSSAPTVTIQQKHALHTYSDPTRGGGFIWDGKEAFHSPISQKISRGTTCKFTATAGTVTNAGVWTPGTYHFEATSTIYAGSMMLIGGFEGGSMYTQLPTLTECTVDVYRNQKSVVPYASFEIKSGNGDATVDLGTFGTGDCNHTDRITFGSNNYAESNIDQYLNSCTYGYTFGDVWEPKTEFDMIATAYPDYTGYFTGFPADFRAALRWCDVHDITSSLYESPDSLYTTGDEYTISRKVWLPSRKEIFGSYDTSYENAAESQFPAYVGTNNAAKAVHTRTGTDLCPYFTRTPYYTSGNYLYFEYAGTGPYAIYADMFLSIVPMMVLG